MQFKKNGDISVSAQGLKENYRAEPVRLIPLPRLQHSFRVRDLLPGLTAGATHRRPFRGSVHISYCGLARARAL